MITILLVIVIVSLYAILGVIIWSSTKSDQDKDLDKMPLWVQKTAKVVKQHSKWEEYRDADKYFDGLNGHETDYSRPQKDPTKDTTFEAILQTQETLKNDRWCGVEKPESKVEKPKYKCERCKDTGIDYLPVKRNILAGQFSNRIPIPCRCIKRADWTTND